jgi:hypothetical protein
MLKQHVGDLNLSDFQAAVLSGNGVWCSLSQTGQAMVKGTEEAGGDPAKVVPNGFQVSHWSIC